MARQERTVDFVYFTSWHLHTGALGGLTWKARGQATKVAINPPVHLTPKAESGVSASVAWKMLPDCKPGVTAVCLA